MYRTISHYILGFLFINMHTIHCNINISIPYYQISYFEHGAHVEGEEINFKINGHIPAFTPIFTQNVTPFRDDLEKRFTYLRVEYVSPMSAVEIIFNQDEYALTFYIRFPFLNIPYGIVGYSIKVLRTSKMWNSWRRSRQN